MPARTNDRSEAILRARAERLALRSTESEGTGSAIVLVIVSLGGEKLGIPVEALREIVPSPPVTRLPGMPSSLIGIAQVRGALLSVVDASSWLKIETTREKLKFLSILQGPEGLLGLAVEDVLGFESIERTSLSYDTNQARKSSTRPIAALTPDFVSVLDVEQLMASAGVLVGNVRRKGSRTRGGNGE